MKAYSAGSAVMESLLYQALKVRLGLIIRTPHQDQLVRKLYAARGTRSIFKSLSIVKRFDNQVWLIKRGKADEDEPPIPDELMGV